MVLVNRMKDPIPFPPHVKVTEWLKELLRKMLTVDEAKRYSIQEVVQVLKTQRTDMDLE